MKWLFVSNVFDLYVRRESLSVMYLSAALKNAGHQTVVTSTNPRKILEALNDFKPDAVGFGTLTGNYEQFCKLARLIKGRSNALILFGGIHPTFNPEIVSEPFIDGICMGEGEAAIVDFANRFDGGGDYQNTPNWIVKHDGRVIKNPLRPLIDDLDTIAFPDRKLFYDGSSDFAENPIKFFLAARGCPYDCSYCFNESFRRLYKGKGKAVRFRSVDNLIAEVAEVKAQYPLQIVWYLADTFVLDKRWLAELCEKHREKFGLPFYGNVRADLVDQQVVDLLKMGGCVSVAMGIEAGDENLRNGILCRNLSNDRIVKAARMIREAGIGLLTFNIIAIPGGTLESDIRTVDLNIKAGVDYPSVSFMIPFPKTRIYAVAAELGLLPAGRIQYDEGYYQMPIVAGASAEKHQRLLLLFALAVEFPQIRRLLPVLLNLPLTPFYKIAYKLWKGYTGKTRIFPYKSIYTQTMRSIWRYLTYKQR